MGKRILHIASWVALFAYMIVTMGNVSHTMSKRVCSGLEVEIMNSGKSHFVSTEDVVALLKKYKVDYKNKNIDSISTENIEQKLQSHPWLENVQCFKTVNNAIKINIWQRTPIVRVMCGSSNYYLDAIGNKMPTSLYNAAYVPVVTGVEPNLQIQNELISLIEFINNDRFLKSQIQQLHINRSKEFVLIPRAGKQEILFGSTTSMEGKFYKLKKLYKEEFGENGWNRYRVIDLRFNNQVVCTKK